MKVLLTGCTGFLGKFFQEELSTENSLYYLSRSTGDYRVNLEHECPHFNQTFDLVIHAAGKAHSVPKTEAEKRQFYDVNVAGTNNLLKGLEVSGVPKQFVFISSVSVYGHLEGINITEDFPLDAKDAYGLSKVQAEIFVTEWCKLHNSVCTILRLPLLVGKNPPGNLGAMLEGIKKGYYFNIGGGKAKKSMVLAEDVACFIPVIAPIGGIYNLTDGKHPTFLSLSMVISKKIVPNLPLIIAKLIGYIGDIFGDKFPINSVKIKKITSDLIFDDKKARKFGWNPQSVLEYLESNNL